MQLRGSGGCTVAVDTGMRQQLFLDAIKEVGTLRKAAAAAHISRSTVAKWRSENTDGFRERFNEAIDDFADSLEEKMFDLLAEMKVGHNPTLLIFALKALRPLKYRELTTVPDENARELLRKLEQFTAQAVGSGAAVDDSQLTALQQVERLLKENVKGG